MPFSVRSRSRESTWALTALRTSDLHPRAGNSYRSFPTNATTGVLSRHYRCRMLAVQVAASGARRGCVWLARHTFFPGSSGTSRRADHRAVVGIRSRRRLAPSQDEPRNATSSRPPPDRATAGCWQISGTLVRTPLRGPLEWQIVMIAPFTQAREDNEGVLLGGSLVGLLLVGSGLLGRRRLGGLFGRGRRLSRSPLISGSSLLICGLVNGGLVSSTLVGSRRRGATQAKTQADDQRAATSDQFAHQHVHYLSCGKRVDRKPLF